jgi:hypothetical protein
VTTTYICRGTNSADESIPAAKQIGAPILYPRRFIVAGITFATVTVAFRILGAFGWSLS